VDGGYSNWNHPVAQEGIPAFPGGDDIGANYYPEMGCYSSNSREDVDRHMKMLRSAGVGVISLTWWGKGSYTDKSAGIVFDAAGENGIKVNFHLEPFPGRSAQTTHDAIKYLIDRFGDHPAFYRCSQKDSLPMFYVYDSYLIPAEEWAKILSEEGALTIRDTAYDSVVIGLWVKPEEEEFMLQGGFDGFYTYFATDGFTYGSTSANWPRLKAWADENGMMFIPSVAPGYIDTRIRPWNGRNTRGREKGEYYDRQWKAALAIEPEIVSITSFNEWHEGTQIEPAVPKSIGDFEYLDYRPLPKDYYLTRTAYWVERMARD
jgi:glycoprotein endo-alpha-1,2-mannosidase